MAEVWVTGARGFIGRHVARRFAAGGHRVSAIGHGAWLEHERRSWGVATWVNSGLTTAGLDSLASQAALPEVVVHLAGGSSVGASIAAPREDHARTVTSSAELAEWVRTRAPACRIVFASSAAVYGEGWERPIPVDAPIRPFSPYGAHKAAAETILRAHARSFGLRVAIVRLFSVYGPGLEKQLVWDLLTRLAQSPRSLAMGGSGEELRDFILVTDAAAMLEAAAAQADVTAPAFNGGSGHGTAVRELVDKLTRLWPARCEAHFSGVARTGDPRSLVADISASSAIQPPSLTPLDAGLQLTIDAAKARLSGR